jgi:GntR family transcriptional regulator, transcriptional repressor for pyruvate dehydrogenase complex
MSDPPTFTPVERQSAVAQSIDQVRELLASGALKPGQQLPAERALAELLGVSRPTVREAIRALSFMGLVETRLGSGTYVSAMNGEAIGDMLSFVVHASHDTLTDLVEVRLHLEVAAAEIATRKIGNVALDALTRLLEDGKRSLRDAAKFAELDLEFHRQVARAAGNEVLARLLLSVSALGLQRRVSSARNINLRRVTLDEHIEILTVLRQRDPVAAREAMRFHMEHALPHLVGPE